jgi:hypothetical protein
MPDRNSEWDAYRLKRRSEPIPPEEADTPPAGAYSPPVVWASPMYAEDVRPGDLDVQPSSPAAPQPPPKQEGSAGPPPHSSGSKMRLILFGIASVTVLTTLIAVPVVAHLTGGSSHKRPEATRQPPPTGTSTTPPPSSVAPSTTGPGCGGGAYKRVGYYVDGKAGWLSGSGGYSGAGCNGRFDALPMSGDAKKADPSLYAQWVFDPRLRRQCKVVLYIPNNANKMYVGGSPAYYTVEQTKGNKRLLSFSIDQPRSLGQWVSSAVFNVDGPFYIRLANTGKDWTDARNTFTHVVAAQARAICS